MSFSRENVEFQISFTRLLNLKASVVTLIVAYLVFKLIRLVYVAFFSSLSHVPGPLLCKFTGAVDAYQSLICGRRAEWMHTLHLTYGPVVRVAPELCSIADPQALKIVYGGKLPKSKLVYDSKTLAGTSHMLTMREPGEVKARRNLLLLLFQRNQLNGYLAEISRFTKQLLDSAVEEQKTEGSVDFFRWFRLLAFDVIGTVAYGVDMEMTADGKTSPLVQLMAQVFFSFLCRDYIPFFTLIQSLKIFPPFNSLWIAEKKIQGYGESILQNMIDKGQTGDEEGKANLLKSLYRASQVDPKITRSHVVTEAATILVAGSDTVSTAMTYACYELSRRPELQKQLREELRSVLVDVDDWPKFTDLEPLPVLNAFIKETLRLWPTVPGPLERTVTEGGIVFSDIYLPENIDVTMQPFTIHRNESIFPDPQLFKPERWLQETPEMRAAFIPFGCGARQCVGMNLAWSEMRLVLGVLIRRFEILPDPQTNDETMKPVEHFFVIPKAMACRLRIEPVIA